MPHSEIRNPRSEIRIIPLGISAAIPAHGRHLSATALDLGGEWILFDCGEGVQYQIQRTALRPSRLSTICITHLHGDHYFGLPGLLTSMAMNGRTEPLRLVAPERLFSLLFALPGLESPPYRIEEIGVPETLTRAVVVETERYTIEARPLDHRVFCAGYRWEDKPGPGNLDVERARALGVTAWADFRRLKAGESVEAAGGTVQPADVLIPPPKPRSFAYLTDTRPCEGGRLLARNANLVVHDATFTDAHAERAVQTGHSTGREAAEVAREAGAKALLLTHLSARIERADTLLAEARAVFPASTVATELEAVRLEAARS